MNGDKEKALQVFLKEKGIRGWHAPRVVSGEVAKLVTTETLVKPSATESADQTSFQTSGVRCFNMKTRLAKQGER
ncbi:hypothetical protein A3J19_04815 [Candidatus Daviesbacteria bacterium RIFCSPLOWO2_02_FULL_41_8]|uniref:Uncharacterized protein n=3 Tax=Candidatus Daviesiibacteriota TaxID=1752718 RepID=A0A1F5NHP0_9BACT|nr:MAG: hypothetical protein A2871_02550 [Candidatus Daviesbacteria bacterium RIFCSPHIGHO2_01_FULL_41_23]OGE33791.1 MAG: hypothetical protein A3D83_04425 [Candidatus Daviesbacteria bacterium RIFCSPHIGHO2_02_FULL_41_10]OGE62057.1 MAG: hypothetical protein A2967_00165 [Candidatus Daviesbacteria bacterium RIFCSPLOWO2_01_FULL_41_32]OGE77022.1 MAG: hypothetical protein A3J19_04815 [Candidatus Daviesbacteria bacterium RIFCSPLOWO2_02_FULL_41_8]